METNNRKTNGSGSGREGVVVPQLEASCLNNPCPSRFDLFEIKFEKECAFVIVLNNKDKAVNIMDRPFLEGLKDIITHLRLVFENGSPQPKYRSVFFCSAKEGSFCHGADVKMQGEFENWDECYEGCKQIKALFQAIEDLPLPTFCFMNAITLGGGLELALSCDYRYASNSVSSIGLPEVKLGIIPGAGGCVRLPRLIGLLASLKLILGGGMISASKALKAGIIDATYKESTTFPAQFLTAPPSRDDQDCFGEDIHTSWIKVALKETKHCKKPVNKYPNRFLARTWPEQQIIYSMTLKSIDNIVNRQFYAPYKLLNLLFECWNATYTEAFDMESSVYADLAMTRQARALQALFLKKSEIKAQAIETIGELNEANGDGGKGSASSTTAKDISGKIRVLIVGSGYMGSALGQNMMENGVEVLFYDANDHALQTARQRVKKLFRKKMDAKTKGLLEDTIFSTDLQDCLTKLCKGDVRPVVLEAVVEDIDLKKKLVKKVLSFDERIIFATNTSSIPIYLLGEEEENADRLIGMHFFHPEHNITPVVEIVPSERTGFTAGETILELAEKMKKVPAVVGDGAGFVVNRLALFWYGIAGTVLVRGGASMNAIEKAMVDAGCMAGPFQILDGVQLTTVLKVGKSISSLLELDESKKDNEKDDDLLQLVQEMVNRGYTGRDPLGNPSKGFYTYNNNKMEQNQEIKSMAHVVRAKRNPSTKANDVESESDVTNGGFSRIYRMKHLSQEEITEALLFAVINEACEIIGEYPSVTAEMIDLLLVLAMGMLAKEGGLLAYADTQGLPYILERLQYFKTIGIDIKISPLLTMLAKDSKFKFRPDISIEGKATSVEVSEWCPSSIGIADAAVAAIVSSGIAWLTFSQLSS
eukprot:m.21971 g.21971  ORF g.21971 m.21971 type:complete len:875 (+) comp5405_c0_seq1:118-2742(+)